MVSLASGADLVCWGPLKLHIILVLIIFSRRFTALTQGLFVSVCLLCPSTPNHLCASSSLYITHLALAFDFGWRIPMFQWFPFSSMPVPLVKLWPEEPFGLRRRVPPSWNSVSVSSKGHSPLAKYSHSSFCQLSCLVLNHLIMTEHPLAAEIFSDSFVCEPVGVEVCLTWLSCFGWMDGWMVING